jgi:hypothetical protein
VFESVGQDVLVRAAVKTKSSLSKYRGIGNPGVGSGRKNISLWLRRLRGQWRPRLIFRGGGDMWIVLRLDISVCSTIDIGDLRLRAHWLTGGKLWSNSALSIRTSLPAGIAEDNTGRFPRIM